VTLREAIGRPPEPGAVPRVPFEALVLGERVRVTAVLERTAVFFREGARAGEGVLAKLEALEVGELTWVVADDSQRVAAKRGRKQSAAGKRMRYGSHRDQVPTGYGGG
jgi:hypothetical protein